VKSERTWLVVVIAFLLYTLLVGGVTSGQPTVFFLLRIFSIGLIVASFLRLRNANPSGTLIQAFMILAAGIGLLLLHLLPLPPVIWQALPGREFVSAAIAAANTKPVWMPLSLSPPLTHLSLLALLPSMAVFLACLTISSRDRWFVVIAILGFVLANIFLGLFQQFQGSENSLYFYDLQTTPTGSFINRNFYAALLYIAIPMTWGLALRSLREGNINRYLIMILTALMLTMIIIGLATAGSRAGILLGMVALLGSSFLAWGQGKKTASQLGARFAVPALVGALLVFGQFGMVAILRLAAIDPVSDLRTQILQETLRAAWAYFPIGSGFGTFGPIYEMHEIPASMIDNYINRAHNDWVELWLEGGIPVALVLAAFLYWYLSNTIRIWRATTGGGSIFLSRAASLAIGLLLFHSIIDFPLRAPAFAALFGIFTAIVATAPIGARAPRHAKPGHRTAVPMAMVHHGPLLAPRDVGPIS
jgi:O-antigen ligase